LAEVDSQTWLGVAWVGAQTRVGTSRARLCENAIRECVPKKEKRERVKERKMGKLLHPSKGGDLRSAMAGCHGSHAVCMVDAWSTSRSMHAVTV
jgi:hypothetical protein